MWYPMRCPPCMRGLAPDLLAHTPYGAPHDTRSSHGPRGGQGRGEDFTPSRPPPMGSCRRPRTTRLYLGASTHNKMVAVRRTRRASIRIGSGLIRSRELSTTYSEDGTHALKMYQQQHQVVRLAHLCRHQRLKVPFVRECAGRFGWNLHGITVSRQYAL